MPDFIVVDGAEGGTGAAPLEFVDHVGTPLQEGLLLVHNTLVGLESARPHQARLQRQDHQRVRRRARDGARRRLVQLGARLHVRARLPAGADLSHGQLPHRCRDAESAAATRRSPCPTSSSASIASITTRSARCASSRRPRASCIRTSSAPRTWCGASRRTRCACSRTCCRKCGRGSCSRRMRAARPGRTRCYELYWPRANARSFAPNDVRRRQAKSTSSGVLRESAA